MAVAIHEMVVWLRNGVDASMDVSVGVMQRIRGGWWTYPEWFGTYPKGLYNVSGVVVQRIQRLFMQLCLQNDNVNFADDGRERKSSELQL